MSSSHIFKGHFFKHVIGCYVQHLFFPVSFTLEFWRSYHRGMCGCQIVRVTITDVPIQKSELFGMKPIFAQLVLPFTFVIFKAIFWFKSAKNIPSASTQMLCKVLHFDFFRKQAHSIYQKRLSPASMLQRETLALLFFLQRPSAF